MKTLEKDVRRMELQIEQLISIVASLNGRLNRFEEMEKTKRIREMHKISRVEHI